MKLRIKLVINKLFNKALIIINLFKKALIYMKFKIFLELEIKILIKIINLNFLDPNKILTNNKSKVINKIKLINCSNSN